MLPNTELRQIHQILEDKASGKAPAQISGQKKTIWAKMFGLWPRLRIWPWQQLPEAICGSQKEKGEKVFGGSQAIFAGCEPAFISFQPFFVFVA